MPTLELVNARTGEPRGSSMTLKDGKLIFEGTDDIQDIVARWRGRVPDVELFEIFINWSNGYAWLRPKKES